MNKKSIFSITFVIIFIIVWSSLIYYFGAQKIVDFIGINNSYLVLFFIGAFGGLSLIAATSYYASLATFASAGLNPILLGILGGIGITIGDSFYYYFGKKSRGSIPPKLQKISDKFYAWLTKRRYFIPIAAFIYFAFTPFPNEFVTIPLGNSGYSYRKLVILLLIGNLILSIFTARYLFGWL